MIRQIIRGFGEAFITLGLVILLFAAYEVYGKAWQVAQDQKRLDRALEQQWDRPPDADPQAGAGDQEQQLPAGPVEDGDPLTKLYIPSLGKDWVVVEGTTLKDIKLAPGHYRESQLPGQAGNFAVAGHRTPAIFWALDKLNNGTSIVVEDRDNYYVYEVYKVHIVKPTDVWVVDPDPDNRNVSEPTRKLLTLTTCHPKLDNYERLVVHAEMNRVQPKSEGKPSEIK